MSGLFTCVRREALALVFLAAAAIFGGLVSAVAYAQTIAPFELPWMNHPTRGTTYKSADHPNGVFVVEAFFRACPYCNINAPNVKQLAAEYSSEPRVQFLDLGRDTLDSDYARWIAQHQPTFPVLKDASRTVINQLSVSGYPSTFVIDCRGQVVYRTLGAWSDQAKAEIRSAIANLLTRSCVPLQE